MLLVLGGIAVCLSCQADEVVRPRGRSVDVQLEQAIPDGCARFQIQANPGQNAAIDTIYGTQFCQTNELKLIQDSAAVFDAATGTLRVPIVVRNVGTRAVKGLLKIRYDADSVQLFDTSGNPVAGTTTIVGLGDSTLNNGRIAYWAYNQLLAPAGQAQVLFAGQTTGRRWLELRGTDWHRVVKIKLFTTARYPDALPAAPPDSVPQWIIADTNYTSAAAGWESVRIAKNALLVFFKATATQSERQAIVDSVGAIAVGGFSFGSIGGEYVLQVASSWDASHVLSAIARFSASNAVAYAVPLSGFGVHQEYRYPDDGLGFALTDWRVRSDTSSTRRTWALEGVRAPLAWGCETGSTTTAIALIGTKLFSADDISPFSVLHGGPDRWLDPQQSHQIDAHATRVASVLSSVGDNHTGLSGIAWRADLRFYERGVFYPSGDSIDGAPDHPTYDMVPRLVTAAALGGAKVINISLGTAVRNRVDSVPTTADSQARTTASRLATVLQSLEGLSIRPLLIIAAGNEGVDARYNGFARVKDPAILPSASIRNRVIVVGGVGSSGQLYSDNTGTSNTGPFVDVYAPAQHVYTRGAKVGGVHLDGFVSGTSFAAPIVAGTASLLMSFDPTRTAEEVGALIRLGAVNGNRQVQGAYIANAYESLKLAAQSASAPICGNRVWAEGSNIKVERGSQVQTIATGLTTSDTIRVVEVAHGGRRIDVGTGQTLGIPNTHAVLTFVNGSWSSTISPQPAPVLPGGTPRSMRVYSHAMDTALTLTVRPGDFALNPTPFFLKVEVGTPVAPFPKFSEVEIPLPSVPWIGNGGSDWYPLEEPTIVQGAYPLSGDTAWIAVTTYKLSWLADRSSAHRAPKQLRLYGLDLKPTPPTLTLVNTLPDSAVYWLGLSEDGHEKVYAVGRDSIAPAPVGYTRTVFSCSVRWSRPRFSANASQALDDSVAPRRVTANHPAACPSSGVGRDDWFAGSGTIAPRTRAGFGISYFVVPDRSPAKRSGGAR